MFWPRRSASDETCSPPGNVIRTQPSVSASAPTVVRIPGPAGEEVVADARRLPRARAEQPVQPLPLEQPLDDDLGLGASTSSGRAVREADAPLGLGEERVVEPLRAVLDRADRHLRVDRALVGGDEPERRGMGRQQRRRVAELRQRAVGDPDPRGPRSRPRGARPARARRWRPRSRPPSSPPSAAGARSCRASTAAIVSLMWTTYAMLQRPRRARPSCGAAARARAGSCARRRAA